MDENAETIRLDIEVAGESMQGRARTGDGFTREFTGWLGLIAALDALITGVRRTAAAAPASPDETDDEARPPNE